MNPKYPALTTIAKVFRVLGWITVFWTGITIVMGILTTLLSGQYLGGGILGFLGTLLGAIWGSFMVLVLLGILGGALAVMYFAAAESIQVFLDIEQNTRSKK